MMTNEAKAAWARRRRRLIAYGRWEPTTHIDPTPVREHIANLRSFGISVKTIASIAGESNGHVAEIIYPNHVAYLNGITAERAAKFLNIRFDLDQIPSGRFVDAAGTRRRIEALMCAGWSQGHIGIELGVSRQSVSKYRRNARVDSDTARAVRDLYDRLWGTQGPEIRVRNKAAREGFAPALAWDDDTIDDPNATPDLGAETPRPQGGAGRPFADVVEDVEDILSWEPYTTATELAHRLGYRDSSGIQIALRRGERTDLLAQLARNAEVAA